MSIRRRVVACVVLACASTAVAAPERALSLEEALAFADANAPAIAVARSRVGVAEADVVAASPWLPTDPALDLGGGGRVGGGQDGADVSVGLSQTLEIFGEGGLRRGAASRGVDVAKIEVQRTRFLVHQAVHRAFDGALVTDAEVEAADAAVAFARRLVEIAETRVRAGDANPLTVRLAQSTFSRAKEQALTARESQRMARLALGREAGFADAIAIAPRGALERPRPLPSTAVLTSSALEHRPGLLALAAVIEAERANNALAEREALPKPVVGIGYAIEGLSPSSLATQQTQQIVGATLQVPLPVFRGNAGERARSAARLRVAEAELEGERRQVAARIGEAWTRTDTARQRVLLFTTELLPGTDETLTQLETAFALGELEIAEVMIGREQLLTVRRESLVAWRTWFEALSALEAEVGTELSTTSPSPSTSSP